MRTTIVYIILSIISSRPCEAQKKYTLQECIEQALRSNTDIKRQRVQVDKQAIETETQRFSRLPNLNADATQKFDFGRSLNRENTFDDSNSQSSSFSLSMELPIFTGFKISNTIAQHKLNLKIAGEDLKKIQNDISLQVATAYYQVLLNKEIAAIAQMQIELSREQQEVTRILVSHGKVPESQILDIEAQLANDELSATKAKNTLRLSMVDLIQLLELDQPETFDIMQVETDEIHPLLRKPDEIFLISEQIMPQVKSAHLTINSQQRAVKIAQSAYYPTLSLLGGLNSGYYHFSNAENLVFNDQIKNNLQKTIYVTLRIPLFNRLNTRNSVRKAKKELEDSRLIAENTSKALYKEIQKAWYDALSAQEKYNSTAKAVVANNEALRYAKEKYTNGKSTVYEYNEARMKLANSQSEQAQAKYEYLLQKCLLDFYAGEPLR